mgnify:CR=1 FL=1
MVSMNRQKRIDNERKHRSDAINRILTRENEEISTLQGRLMLSQTFNIVFLLFTVVFSAVQFLKGGVCG